MPLRVTPKGSSHLADLIWRAEPPLDERTHLAAMASRRPEGTSARAPRATTSLNKLWCPPTTSLNKLWTLTEENAPLSTLAPFPGHFLVLLGGEANGPNVEALLINDQ
jgi:hypothetical protein